MLLRYLIKDFLVRPEYKALPSLTDTNIMKQVLKANKQLDMSNLIEDIKQENKENSISFFIV
jgi:hypothetical protein